MNTLKKNMLNIYGTSGEKWISDLSAIVDKLINIWHLHHVQPINNMSFHYVAKAASESNHSLVLKIGIDNKVIESEMHALSAFAGHAAVKLIDYNKKYNALLLQQAVPGHSLKSIYPEQYEYVINSYINTVTKLHKQILIYNYSFPTINEWLISLDRADANAFPNNLLNKAVALKNKLLASTQKKILLHGDLHHDNILFNNGEWIIIDPKGVVGEAEFELAAFDFIHSSEFESKYLKKKFEDRLDILAQKSQLNPQRIKDWVFVRLILSAAWSIEDKDDPSWVINLAQKLF